MISIKKLAVTGAAAGLLLASAVPVFAGNPGGGPGGPGGPGGQGKNNDELSVDQDNDAWIINDVVTKADTGDNTVGGGQPVYTLGGGQGGQRGSNSGGRIVTGDAYADATVGTTANLNVAKLNVKCDCFDEVDVDQDNDAFVLNDVETKADTGDNSVSGGSNSQKPGGRRGGHQSGSSSLIRTGNAAAWATVGTVVNKNVAIVGK